jgi:ribosomal protein S27E
MTTKEARIHFNSIRTRRSVACGNHTYSFNMATTTVKADVTCLACRRTILWRKSS